MKGIILAAGRGSRMGNARKNKPKCLLKINGRPIIDYQMEALRNAGAKKIGIITGYQSSQLIGIADATFFNDEWAQTNMAYSLTFASDWLSSDECLVSYSDIFYESKIASNLAESPSQVAIAYDPLWENLWSQRFADPLDDAETFQISQDNFLLEIGDKPKGLDEIHGQYMGLWKFKPEGWQIFEKILKKSIFVRSKNVHLTKVLQDAIDQGLKVKALPNRGSWGEVDSSNDLNLYNQRSADPSL